MMEESDPNSQKKLEKIASARKKVSDKTYLEKYFIWRHRNIDHVNFSQSSVNFIIIIKVFQNTIYFHCVYLFKFTVKTVSIENSKIR